jgi:hypothetical protein
MIVIKFIGRLLFVLILSNLFFKSYANSFGIVLDGTRDSNTVYSTIEQRIRLAVFSSANYPRSVRLKVKGEDGKVAYLFDKYYMIQTNKMAGDSLKLYLYNMCTGYVFDSTSVVIRQYGFKFSIRTANFYPRFLPDVWGISIRKEKFMLEHLKILRYNLLLRDTSGIVICKLSVIGSILTKPAYQLIKRLFGKFTSFEIEDIVIESRTKLFYHNYSILYYPGTFDNEGDELLPKRFFDRVKCDTEKTVLIKAK